MARQPAYKEFTVCAQFIILKNLCDPYAQASEGQMRTPTG